MPYCCGRSFSDHGYQQHLNYSATHASSYDNYECDVCDDRFASQRSLDQHHNACHAPSYDYECDICDLCFTTQRWLDEHMEEAPGHQNYCYSCKRSFNHVNNLNQHLRSSIHVGKNVKCPWCPNKFTNLTGVTLHLESGSCPSGIKRRKIDQYCREVDRDHVFTNKMIEYHGGDHSTTTATNAAWDGHCFRCYFCPREFSDLRVLNQHLSSPVHQQKIYHCPRCQREYTVLSGLVNHLESESCGAWRFGANSAGVNRVVGRLMIAG